MYVSTHAPARGQSFGIMRCGSVLLFQLMPPRGGNHSYHGGNYERRKVSTHAPARGQSRFVAVWNNQVSCFNSCPREGAIVVVVVLVGREVEVSTHAPARGQSEVRVELVETLIVSTHAPARGQSWFYCLVYTSVYVSTHAPARGQSSSS